MARARAAGITRQGTVDSMFHNYAVRTIGLALALAGAAFTVGEVSMAEAKPVAASEAPADARLAHQQDVTFLREEEKLARDVYITLYKRWGLRIFSNISQAEQRHMDRMGMLIRRYQILDPVVDDTVGVFTNTELAGLYTTLVKKGSASEVDALKVGATIEDLDIRDIIAMKARTNDSGALDAFAKLECGSRNHMRAFHRQLAARGVTYAPQYLSQKQLDAIVAGSHERCGRMGRRGAGRGKGPGRGRGHGWRR